MALDVGTIGSLKCEVSLNKILMEINDTKINYFVVGKLVKYRLGLKQFLHIPDEPFRHTMLNRWRIEFTEKVVARKLPPAVESHMCCCIMTHYRIAAEFKQ